MSAPRFRGPWPRLAVLLASALALQPLVACAELELGAQAAKLASRSTSTSGTELAQATPQAAPQNTVSQYLQAAPQIFEATGLAVWDGKRTLQGVWVAHPLASSARRVRIYNTQNGLAVDGALFKRDSALSGASVLISSEAASLLQMQANESAELRIVAVTPIRRTEPVDDTAQAAKPAAPATPEPAAPAAPKPAAPKTTAVPKPAESAATVAAKPTPGPKTLPAPQREATESGGLKWETVTPDPQTPNETAPSVAPVTAKADPVPAPVTPKPKPKAPAVRTTTAPAADPKPTAAAPAQSNLRRPYIQAGVFGVAANANALVKKLKAKGLPALGKPTKSGKLTRVLAGPFATTAERSEAQSTIRKMGLPDAAPVRR